MFERSRRCANTNPGDFNICVRLEAPTTNSLNFLQADREWLSWFIGFHDFTYWCRRSRIPSNLHLPVASASIGCYCHFGKINNFKCPSGSFPPDGFKQLTVIRWPVYLEGILAVLSSSAHLFNDICRPSGLVNLLFIHGSCAGESATS